MKKFEIVILSLAAAAIFFTGGFFLGRETNEKKITVDVSPTVTQASSSAPDIAAQVISQPEIDEIGTININTATAEELDKLPGIGEVLAGRIIDYRTENGAFSTTEELLNVDGVGTQKYAKILEYITVS